MTNDLANPRRPTAMLVSTANAIIGMRHDANEIMDGITEGLAHGTAVVVE